MFRNNNNVSRLINKEWGENMGDKKMILRTKRLQLKDSI